MRTCYKCGAELGETYPVGVCPDCLLKGEDYALPVCDDFDERYEFLDDRPLSQGGQGCVFSVKDLRLGRNVALKRLADDAVESTPARSRFLAEAQMASQLNHPGFLPIYDAGVDPEGRPFYTTALLSGQTFRDVIRTVHNTGRNFDLELRRALQMVRQVCQAVGYAHDRGLVHRDLKPANVLIGQYGEVFVIDLGSAGEAGLATPTREAGASGSGTVERAEVVRARSTDHDPISALATRGADVPTTPVFTPPERLDSPAVPAGPPTDIYALGATLYELCCGRLPYSLPDGKLPPEEELVKRIKAGPPAPVRQLNRAIPRDLEGVCAKAMAREPSARYGTAAELAEDIQAFLETRVVTASRPGAVAKLKKWALRNSRHLAVATLVVAVISVALALAYSFKVQSDQARQLSYLRAAQMAARNGQWRAVPDHLLAAERAGYTNFVDLALQRIEAWTVLSEHGLVDAELSKLQKLGNLGPYRGAVLVRLAEHELFDRSTAEAGLEHIRQALKAGLDKADEAFARGMLAETTPEALAFFHQALNRNPYHHGAHRHSLGLEFLLGQYETLDRHFTVLRTLYPEDASAVILQAVRLALEGRAVEAEKMAAPLQRVMNPSAWRLFMAGLEVTREAPKLYDLDALLQDDQAEAPKVTAFMNAAVAFFLNNQQPAQATNQVNLRIPNLPCIKNGLIQGVQGLLRLVPLPLLSAFGDPEPALEKIRTACRAHPESLLPLSAAAFLEPRRPSDARKLREFLGLQSDFYQQAVELPSVLPNAHRFARFMAALTQLELGHRLSPPDLEARRSCLKHLRWFASAENTSAAQYKACFSLAFELGENDLAREFLTRWERVSPEGDAVLRARILVEMASQTYPAALHGLDKLLAANPTNRWALDLRQKAVVELKKLGESWEPTLQPQDQGKR